MPKKILKIIFATFGLIFSLPLAPALAQADPKKLEEMITAASTAASAAQTSADNGYMLLCSALVLLMTPGLAFFYGGFVAKRNILNTLMMSFLLMGIVGVSWVLWGYSLAFAPGTSFIGGLQWLFLNGVGIDVSAYLPKLTPDDAVTSYAATIPHQTFMIYQAMFAIITPALISGAIVERISFKAYTLFMLLWSTLIYCPLAHMVWAKGGMLGLYGGIGALDFAGGTVVHISSGVSALVAAIVIGARRTYPDRLTAPHNVPFILLGAGLLWFGWFGFNAGSALGAGSLATVAFVATNSATAAAMLTWLILEQVLKGKPTAVGAATGAVAGLVGVTPAAGFVNPIGAILIGSITATCCFFAISFKSKLGIDDALDTYPVHGVGGTVGAILTGVFAVKAVNSAGADGLIAGKPGQVVTQIIAVVVAYLIAGIGTFIILQIVKALVGLRVKPEVEFQGMDINEHGEEGYGEEFGGGVSQMGGKASPIDG
ncbi:ammonium transporter [Pseudanabaena sp. PCC 6802]|uniref:ammonium transporter n=1 Tax=Pseudanabaena sp. PCC 6802 TaxID=118173 RepID=UPI000349239F|nr:ammonium transporter [Pseudanabaena sp. PCC 6802]